MTLQHCRWPVNGQEKTNNTQLLYALTCLPQKTKPNSNEVETQSRSRWNKPPEGLLSRPVFSKGCTTTCDILRAARVLFHLRRKPSSSPALHSDTQFTLLFCKKSQERSLDFHTWECLQILDSPKRTKLSAIKAALPQQQATVGKTVLVLGSLHLSLSLPVSSGSPFSLWIGSGGD